MPADPPFISGLSHSENETVTETLELYEFTPAQEAAVRAAIARRWKETSGRFYAYNVAHEFGAAMARGDLPYDAGEDAGATPPAAPGR